MVGIGIVGIGFMGMIHYLASERVAGAKVVAFCSRDQKKLSGDWTGIQGNFGPPGTQMDLSEQTCVREFDELLTLPDVELVDLCVPNGLHADLAVKAMEAGKHVLVEKPIAMSLEDADRMLETSERTGKTLMVAHVLPFFPEFKFAREAIASNQFGKLKAVHLKRVISKPDMSDDEAIAATGGPAVDLHIHDTHYVGLVVGTPRAVRSRGVFENGHAIHLDTQYLFDDPELSVSAISGALSMAGRAFNHGFEFYLDRATLCFEFATLGDTPHVATQLMVMHHDGQIEYPTLGDGDPIAAFASEIEAASRVVKTGIEVAELSGRLARQALNLCEAEVRSARTGETVLLG